MLLCTYPHACPASRGTGPRTPWRWTCCCWSRTSLPAREGLPRSFRRCGSLLLLLLGFLTRKCLVLKQERRRRLSIGRIYMYNINRQRVYMYAALGYTSIGSLINMGKERSWLTFRYNRVVGCNYFHAYTFSSVVLCEWFLKKSMERW